MFGARIGRAQTKSEQQLCQRVNEFNTAWTHADFGTLNLLLAPGYVHIDDHGLYQPRSQWLKVMHRRAGELKTLRITMKEVRIRMLGGAAVVTGEDIIQPVKANGRSGEHLRFTQVWTRGASGWQRLRFQATPVIGDMKLSDVKCEKGASARCTGKVTFTMPARSGTQHTSSSASKGATCTFVQGS